MLVNYVNIGDWYERIVLYTLGYHSKMKRSIQSVRGRRLLLHKLNRVRLVQNTRIQDITGRRPNEINLHVLLIQELQLTKAVVVAIGKGSVRSVCPVRVQTLNVTSTTSNNVHWSLRVVHAVGIRRAVDDGVKSLGIMHVPENTDVDAILVEDVFECRLARVAAVADAGAVPWSVAGSDHPRCDGAVDAGEIGAEEV